MREKKVATPDEKVECKVCLKEVPLSEAKSEEATDYILHFCGVDCYEKWQKRNETE